MPRTMDPVPPPPLVDINEAAVYLGRNVAFVRRLLARREIAFYKVGAAIRFDVNDLLAYLKACRVESGSELP